MLKNNKGFTLVELLAVIVILGVILAIAIPSITGLIATQKARAFESSAKMILKGIEYKLLEDPTFTPITEVTENTDLTQFGANAADYSAVTIGGTPGAYTIDLTGAGKFANCDMTGPALFADIAATCTN